MRNLFVSILFFLFSLGNSAQTFKFDHIGEDQNLNEKFVECLATDNNDFLWIGTNSGLYRYDGSSCKLYQKNEKDSNSLIENIIFSLALDYNGNLWVGQRYGGICIYDQQKDNFTRLSIPDNDEEFKNKKNSVRRIFKDKSDNMWILTAYGIARFIPSSKSWKWYEKSIENIDLANKYSNAIVQTPDGQIWVGQQSENVLLKYNSAKDEFSVVPIVLPEKMNNLRWGITTLGLDNENNLWIGTDQIGIIRFNIADNKFTKFTHNDNDSNSIGSNEICSFLLDRNNNIWVGAINGGLNLFNKTTENFTRYIQSEKDRYSLNSNSISVILESREGDLFLGTHSGGVNILNKRKNNFKYLGANPDSNKSLRDLRVSVLYHEGNGIIWIGTDGGGLHRYDSISKKIDVFTAPKNISSNAVLDIEPNGDGKLWIASWGGGVCLFDPKTKKSIDYVPIEGKKDWINFNCVKGIEKDGDYLWIGTHGKGLNIFDIKRNTFYNDQNPSPLFPFDMNIPYWNNDIVKDSRGNFWICTNLALYMYDGKNLHKYFHDPADTNSVSGNYISMVYEDSQNRLWICSEGLDQFDYNTGKFKHYNSIYNQMPASSRAICRDNRGLYWVSSIEGISCFSIDSAFFRHYTVEDGLPSNTFINGSVMTSGNGSVFFGSTDGMVYFAPNAILDYTTPPNVIITSCNIWQNFKETYQGSSLKLVNILSSDLSAIPYDKSGFISFEYLATGHQSPSKKQYAYWLEGFDEHKFYVGNELKASYTNLPPGTYTFRVIAANCDGYWNQNGASLEFTILPPWWKTWWFYTLVILFVLGSFVLIMIVRTRSIMEQNRILESEVASRTKELVEANKEIELKNESLSDNQKTIEQKNNELSHTLETKNRLLSIIAHDLKNPLGAVVGVLELLFKNFSRYQDDKKFKLIDAAYISSKKLQDELLNLLEWARSQSRNLSYSPGYCDLTALVNESMQLLDETARTKNIKLNFTTTDRINGYVDSRMISTVIRNLIGNAIKFTPENGKIEVNLKINDITVELSVCDSGVGMSQEQMDSLFNPEEFNSTYGTNSEKGTGLGLKICHEFVLKNNGKILVNSEKDKGTTFTVILPRFNVNKPIIESSAPETITTTPAGINQNSNFHEYIILIIEDNDEMRDYLQMVFSDDFKIITAADGIEGKHKTVQLIPDLILSDIKMPLQNGIEMCKELKSISISSHIPIILVTSEAAKESELEGLRTGAIDYIRKPFDIDILKARVFSIIKSVQEQRDYARKQMYKSLSQPDFILPSEYFLQKIMEELEKEYSGSKLSIDYLANQLSISPVQLYRKCKAILDVTPDDLISNFRLRKSLELLQKGNYNIEEIASAVGFNDVDVFKKEFFEKFHKTPEEMRQ